MSSQSSTSISSRNERTVKTKGPSSKSYQSLSYISYLEIACVPITNAQRAQNNTAADDIASVWHSTLLSPQTAHQSNTGPCEAEILFELGMTKFSSWTSLGSTAHERTGSFFFPLHWRTPRKTQLNPFTKYQGKLSGTGLRSLAAPSNPFACAFSSGSACWL
jgi:hypothetical protein